MRTSRFRKIWALALILAISLATMSHTIAMTTTGGHPVLTASGHMSGASGCKGCGDHTLIPMGSCVTPFCSVLPSTEIGGLVAFPAMPTRFIAAKPDVGPGITPAPDPYPPRS